MREVKKVVEAFENAINDNQLIGSKCNSCGNISVPPRPVCLKCRSEKFSYEEVNGNGKLISWTVIHIAPPTYTYLAPYTLAIVQLKNGEQLTGILELLDEMKPIHNMKVKIAYEEGVIGIPRIRWVPLLN